MDDQRNRIAFVVVADEGFVWPEDAFCNVASGEFGSAGQACMVGPSKDDDFAVCSQVERVVEVDLELDGVGPVDGDGFSRFETFNEGFYFVGDHGVAPVKM